MWKSLFVAASLMAASAAHAAAEPRKTFSPTGADRAAIEALLKTYTTAISTGNEALFEGLMLNPDIVISDADGAVKTADQPHGMEDYKNFRRGFQGPASTMRFQNVRIEQDGPLAQVSLVFIKTTSGRSDWGFKSLQLLKVADHWKIASELFTYH